MTEKQFLLAFILTVLITVPTNYLLWNVTYREYFGNLTLKIFNTLDFTIGTLLLICYLRANKTKNKVFKRNYVMYNQNTFCI